MGKLQQDKCLHSTHGKLYILGAIFLALNMISRIFLVFPSMLVPILLIWKQIFCYLWYQDQWSKGPTFYYDLTTEFQDHYEVTLKHLDLVWKSYAVLMIEEKIKNHTFSFQIIYRNIHRVTVLYICILNTNDARHEKTDLKVFVVRGHAHPSFGMTPTF